MAASNSIETHLQPLIYYHGFLPREELPYLLKKRGEFLVRISEVENKKTGKEDERNVIVSVCTGEQRRTKAQGQFHDASNMLSRNLVLYTDKGLWWLYPENKMSSVREVIEFHQTHSLQSQKVTDQGHLKLETPIARATWELHHKDITLEKQLGHGEFGEVRAGKLNFRGQEVDVAVKLTKGVSDLSKAKRVQMMCEARLMRYLGHPNVIRLYGIAVLQQPLYIVLEMASSGGLDSFMKKNEGRTSLELKAQLALDAAAGIEYLHFKHVLHRDLAARNCLVHKDARRPIVKISDFGLSRHGDTYKLKVTAKMPIKWLAPEVLKTFVFTQKTDVWAYGVILFEIFSDGKDPWPGMTNTEVKRWLLEGKTFDFECMPSNLKQFVRENLWHQNPDKRPTMADIASWMEKFSATKKMTPTAEDVVHNETALPRTPSAPNLSTVPPGEARDESGSGRTKMMQHLDVSQQPDASSPSRFSQLPTSTINPPIARSIYNRLFSH